MRTVPREVGCRLHALTVMAGKRCRGSPNLSSESGCTWNWMVAPSRCRSAAAAILDDRAVDEDVLFQPQIKAVQCGLQEAARRGPAAAALLVDVEIACPLVVAGVEIRNPPDSHLFGGVADRVQDCPGQPRRLD